MCIYMCGINRTGILLKCSLAMAFLLLIVLLSLQPSKGNDAVPDAFMSLSSVTGRKVELPCDIISPIKGDEVYLVLWYKDESTTPIYSVDSRKGHITQARHAANDNLARRAYFSSVAKPSVLELKMLVAEDEGEYRCRVDFRKARTRHSTVYLQVIVPPGNPVIKNSNDEILQGIIGPYNEGEPLLLICESEGGKPPPSLTWWRGAVLLDDSYDAASTNRIRNELEITVLQRQDLMATYVCQASNNNISVPTTTSVMLEMNFKPMNVRIEGERYPFIAMKPVELICVTSGSRPQAVISWRKGNTKLKAEKERTSGNVVTSTLIFIPSSEDNGKFLYCQANNPVIPGSSIEDAWKLEVYFPPQLNLRLGNKLRHFNIQEGNDVYFECNIRANPWVTEIGWKFDNHELYTNITAGIIVSNQTLVLQRVQRSSRGKYSCMASNSEGQGGSNLVHLRVQFAPVCKDGQKTLYGAILHSAVKIVCEVEADPSDVAFRWELNNTLSTLQVAPFRSTGTRSVVNHIPRSDFDFGTFYCWGKNSVGIQREPCVYTVIPAGLPGSVKNCSINSETERSFLLHCLEGEDGGIVQMFYMEVREALTHKLEMNLSSDKPIFVARGLPPGTSFLVTVYARNARGSGPGAIVRVGTLPAPESQTQRDDVWHLGVNPVLVALLAIVGGLVAVVLSIVLYIKVRHRQQVRKAASRKMDSCNSTTAPGLFKEDGCDLYACEARNNEKQTVLITDNGMAPNGKNRAADGGLIFVNSNCVGWKKIPLSKSTNCDINDRAVAIVPSEDKDGIAVSTPPSSQTESPPLLISEAAIPSTPKCNSRYPSTATLTDDSNSTLPLISNRHTEV